VFGGRWVDRCSVLDLIRCRFGCSVVLRYMCCRVWVGSEFVFGELTSEWSSIEGGRRCDGLVFERIVHVEFE